MNTVANSLSLVIAVSMALTLATAGVSAASAQTFTVVQSFDGLSGAQPNAAIIRSSGNVYGTTTSGGNMSACSGFGCGTVLKLNRTGETVLYSFTGGADGSGPIGGVIADGAGNLYGTTSAGGTGFGVVFKLDPTGVETVLHSFKGSDGEWPHAGVVLDSAGDIFGTSEYGGAFFAGLVYKIDANGVFSVLYSFTGGADGAYPQGALIMDPVGNVYGTTTFGGAHGSGVVYKLDATGKETVLYSFTGGNDGKNPYSGVTFDKAGNLYGTTQGGGNINLNAGYGYGAVYKLDAALSFTVLYSFTGEADGSYPAAGVIADSVGSLYGTTLAGGNPACTINNSVGCGVVFKLDTSGTLTALHTFAGPTLDGGSVQANLMRDAAGNLYGTSSYGGASGLGEIFRITPF